MIIFNYFVNKMLKTLFDYYMININENQVFNTLISFF